MSKGKGNPKKNISLILGIILISIVLLFWLISFIWLPHNPAEMNTSLRCLKPFQNPGFILGTDNFGRDVLSRMLVGSRSVLLVGVVSVAAGAAAGTLFGAAAGIFKGFVSSFIMRAADGLMAFPGILLAMMMVAVIGKGNTGAIISISLFIVPVFTRLVYSLILENENLLFVKAAKSHGITGFGLLYRHYIPVFLPRLVTQFTSCIASAIMIEASLSLLGLGIQPPNASWGLMLNDAKQYFLQYPYLALPPGIAIAVTVMGFNLLGDGLNERLMSRRSKQ